MVHFQLPLRPFLTDVEQIGAHFFRSTPGENRKLNPPVEAETLRAENVGCGENALPCSEAAPILKS